jgi:hypothetical protein
MSALPLGIEQRGYQRQDPGRRFTEVLAIGLRRTEGPDFQPQVLRSVERLEPCGTSGRGRQARAFGTIE